MTWRRLLLSLFLLPALLLSSGGCALEPINGCTLAAANRREVLRAQSYLHRAIPARILAVSYAGAGMGHAALIYRLDEGWCCYDDSRGTRQLDLPATSAFPAPLVAARAAFPDAAPCINDAHWYVPRR